MTGVPFLSKILALAGIGVRNQTDNKEVLINVSSGQAAGSTVTVDLPSTSGQLALRSEVVLSAEKAAANGVATLDGSGKIPSSQLPAIAISNTYVISSQAAQLALSANVGDIAIRTDIGESFILQSLPASILSNWVELLESSGVQSVNGQTGPNVTLGAASVGAVAKIGDTMTGVLTMDPVSTGSGETGQIAFRELAANGIYSVTLRAPDALSDYVVLTLPTSHGSPGQILTSNGSGVMSWQDAPVDSVTSVNGLTGAVTLTAASVGAVAKTGDTMSGALVMGPTGTLAGQGGKISFRELAANGTNSVSLIAPDSVASDITFVLPGADGSAGQVLITNGSGVLAWSTITVPVTSVNGLTGAVNLTTSNINEGSNLYFTDARAKSAAVLNSMAGNQTDQAPSVQAVKDFINLLPAGVISINGLSGIVTITSDGINEGATNLYFTETRAKSAAVINSTTGSQTDQAASVSAMKSYVASSSPVLSVNTKTGIVTLTTSDIGEGTNLYFTEERAKSAVVLNSLAGTQIDQAPSVSAVKAYVAASAPVLSVNTRTGAVVLNTDDISEGSSNLYFTDARAKSAAVINSTAGSQIDQAASVSALKAYVAASSPVLSVNTKTGTVVLSTSDIGEGTNLYFTDARAKSAAVVNSTAGSQIDQAASVSALKAYVAASSPVLSVNGQTGAVSLSAADVGAVAKTGDTMSGALIMAPTGTLSGQTGAIKLQELAANGSNSVTIRAADSMAADVFLTLPATAGVSGQVLTTNGYGELSWSAAVDAALTLRVEKLEASRGIYSGTLQSAQELNISGLVGAADAEHPIVQIYKVDDLTGTYLQVNVEFSFDPVTKVITFGEVIDGPIDAVVHVLALTAPFTAL